MMTAIEAFHENTGQWVELAEWDEDNSDFDAAGWMERWGERIGVGCAELPITGMVDLSAFSVVRRKQIYPR